MVPIVISDPATRSQARSPERALAALAVPLLWWRPAYRGGVTSLGTGSSLTTEVSCGGSLRSSIAR